MMKHCKPVALFISYAHEDKLLLHKLETHLILLKKQGLISIWYDRLIVPGTDWTRIIDQRLEQASIILLLVSPDYLASDYCFGIEMKRALELHEAGKARVVPILLRPVDWQEARRLYEQLAGTEHVQTARCQNNLAGLYVEQERYAEAEPLYVQALRIYERQLGPEHIDTAACLGNLGVLYEKQRKYTEAEAMYQRILKIHKQQLGTEHVDTAISLAYLGSNYVQQGKYEEAEPLFEQASQIYERQMGLEYQNTANCIITLIWLYDKQRKYKKAESLVQRTLALYEQQLGKEHPHTQLIRGFYLHLPMMKDPFHPMR